MTLDGRGQMVPPPSFHERLETSLSAAVSRTLIASGLHAEASGFSALTGRSLARISSRIAGKAGQPLKRTGHEPWTGVVAQRVTWKGGWGAWGTAVA